MVNYLFLVEVPKVMLWGGTRDYTIYGFMLQEC